MLRAYDLGKTWDIQRALGTPTDALGTSRAVPGNVGVCGVELELESRP